MLVQRHQKGGRKVRASKRWVRHLTTITLVLLTIVTLALCGCGGFGGGSGGESGDSSSDTQIRRTTSSAYEVKLGAQNPMANDSLQMVITNVERRPLSTFTNLNDTDASSQSKNFDDMSDQDIAIEVDISYTFNSTTLTTNTQQYGGELSSLPSNLSDVLLPGELMYITGIDADGNEYIASDVLQVRSSDASSTLGTNAQWDYNVLDSALPQAAQTKTGSMVFEVSSTASDLTLHIITASKNAEPLDSDAVATGNNYHYTLDMS